MFCSPDQIPVIKSRRMRRTGHTARMGGEEMETVDLEHLVGVDGG